MLSRRMRPLLTVLLLVPVLMLMQTPRVNALDAFEKTELLSTLRDVVDDPEVRAQIDYVSMTGQATVDLEAGTQTRAEATDSDVNAIRGFVGTDQVDRSGGRLEIGDRIYLIDQADLTNEPTTNDRIVDGSVTLEVVAWRSDPLELAYLITARKT